MKNDSTGLLDSHAAFFKSLSEPVRLRIIALLASRASLCVCDLVSLLGLPQSTVSRHLAYLREQSLVVTWREGAWMHYALNSNTGFYRPLVELAAGFCATDICASDLVHLKNYEASPRVCGEMPSPCKEC